MCRGVGVVESITEGMGASRWKASPLDAEARSSVPTIKDPYREARSSVPTIKDPYRKERRH
jgi:hypothetical protein